MARTGMTSRKPLAAPARPLRLWKAGVALAVVGAWAYLLLAADGGWLDLQERRDRLQELQQEVLRLEAVNDSLRLVLERLETDPAFLEKVAREQFGMVKPGERLYRIRTTDAETGGRR